MAEEKNWPPEIDSPNGYYDLGKYHRQVTTTSAEAQLWFDRGLIWSFSFNHEESARCFERASTLDPECGMAFFGHAYALGPNYNQPWSSFGDEELGAIIQQTHSSVEKAQACVNVSSVEKALIRALRLRYQQDKPPKDCSIWNSDYAGALETVYTEFSDDLDVATFYADSLMNLTPWALWDLKTGKPAANARTLEAKHVIERALEQPGGLAHPGLIHLYIHLMEMSPSPESALPIASRLPGLVPDAGHLHHMPSHLEVLCGNYGKVISWNTDAINADAKYLKYAGFLNIYTLYRCHNYHFLIYGAMFAGKLQPALTTVANLEASIPESLLLVPGMADYLETFLGMRLHVLIRFGCWTDILLLPLPENPSLYCVLTALTHYAHAIAFSNTSNLAAAESSRELFRSSKAAVPSSRTLFNNTSQDLLGIASAMLDGEISFRQGAHKAAFESLAHATHLSDNLPYDEPWGWMQPVRHAHGALLLEHGEKKDIEEAMALYKADLGFDDTLPRALRHPRNVWALHGYHECLEKLGRKEEAAIAEKEMRTAMAEADVEIKASCYCRVRH